MALKNDSVEIMWESYLSTIGEKIGTTDKEYISWYFCENKKQANELAILVKKGIKKATTSLYYWYEVKGEELPKVGDINIVENWDDLAQCVIQTRKISILPFGEVREEFAKKEGEGDMSLGYWRRAHIDFFTNELEDEGLKFTEDMMVVCEEFEVIYKD